LRERLESASIDTNQAGMRSLAAFLLFIRAAAAIATEASEPAPRRHLGYETLMRGRLSFTAKQRRTELPHAAPDRLPVNELQAFPATFGPAVISPARLPGVECNRLAPG
jgi:hypothetical protein